MPEFLFVEQNLIFNDFLIDKDLKSVLEKFDPKKKKTTNFMWKNKGNYTDIL